MDIFWNYTFKHYCIPNTHIPFPLPYPRYVQKCMLVRFMNCMIDITRCPLTLILTKTHITLSNMKSYENDKYPYSGLGAFLDISDPPLPTHLTHTPSPPSALFLITDLGCASSKELMNWIDIASVYLSEIN